MAGSIQTQIRQLEEFGALQRRFTSDVSHELRTPLTTVRMAADVLHASKDQLLPALRRSSELLVTELDRFEALLADLLEITRLTRASPSWRRTGSTCTAWSPARSRPCGGSPRMPARRCGCTCPSGSTPRSTRAGSSGSCATSWRTPSTTARGARSTSRWQATTTPWRWWCATTVSGCGRGRPRSCSTASGGRRSRGPAAAVAAGSVCRSASRTPACTAAGCRRGASPAAGPRSGSRCRAPSASRSRSARCRWCRTTAPRTRVWTPSPLRPRRPPTPPPGRCPPRSTACPWSGPRPRLDASLPDREEVR